MTARVTLLLGKPPRQGTLLADVARSLERSGVKVSIKLPHDEPVSTESLEDQDLVVHRGLNPESGRIVSDLHTRGVTLCNPFPAQALLQDRLRWLSALAAAGLSVPSSSIVESWEAVREQAAAHAVVAKAIRGTGRGVGVLGGTADELPAAAPFAGPYLVEERLVFDGTDRKLYVIGDQVRGLLKPSTLSNAHETGGQPFEPGPELVDLALRSAQALDVHLAGVDVVATPSGPVIVDVNPFPGYRGIANAPRLVATHLLSHLA